jgi:hypothetical protein
VIENSIKRVNAAWLFRAATRRFAIVSASLGYGAGEIPEFKR